MSDDASGRGLPEQPFDLSATRTTSGAANSREDDWRTLPSRIGHYRIIRLLGEGGMGSVYEAEQEQPRRRVALKVIKAGWAGPDLLRRFEHESQALGRLQHAGIAQIYEAGTAVTDFGLQPFFAMELIHGIPLDDYADSTRVNVRQRLGLMIDVCDAVQHAHDRGIIHRDLKPGNILVDEHGQPKILDFGLARATDSDARATRQTDIGQLLGTLAYMSPEQVSADPLALDTRSDVYALGVVLYELLAGKLPYRVTQQVHEVVQTIQHSDPLPLSSVNRIYRGDIETIVAKALEKDRDRRYGSAADLAADIHRYLEDKPIAAKPPSTLYQLQKFARRHKALVAGTASVFVVLAAGAAVSTVEAARARTAERTALQQRDRAAGAERVATVQRDRAVAAESVATVQRDRAVAAEASAEQERNAALTEKQRADAEAASSKAVSSFLENDLLAQASSFRQSAPGATPDPDLKVRTALDRAAGNISGRFTAQPDVEASVRKTIGRTYADLGLYAEAGTQLERSLELQRRRFGADSRPALEAASDLALAKLKQGSYAEAEAELTQTLQTQRRVLGPEDRSTLITTNSLASAYLAQAKYAQAEALDRQTMEIRKRTLGAEHPATLGSMGNLANDYYQQGKYSQAEALYNQGADISRRIRGAEYPDTLSFLHNLGSVYMVQGKYPQAAVLYAQIAESRSRVLGPEHPDTLSSLMNLSNAYSQVGKSAQAEATYRQIDEIQRRTLGVEHPSTLRTENGLARSLYRQGKYAQAEALVSRIAETQRRLRGPDHPDTLEALTLLASVYRRQAKFPQAEALYIQTLDGERRALGPEHLTTVRNMIELGAVYLAEYKYAQAEALYVSVLEIQRRALRPGHPDFLISSINLGAIYYAEGKYTEGEALLKETVETSRRTVGPEHPYTVGSMDNLAETLAAEGNYAEAESLFDQVVAISRRALGAENPITLSVLTDAAYMHQQRGNYATAQAYAAEILAARRKTLKSEHPDTMASAADLALAYLSQAQFVESASLAREAFDVDRKTQPDDWQSFRAETLLGASLAGLKKYADAEPLLLEGYRGMDARRVQMGVPYLYHLDRARDWIIQLYEASGRPEKAAPWKLDARTRRSADHLVSGTGRRPGPGSE